MLKFFLKRLAAVFLVLFIILTIVYFLVAGLGPKPFESSDFATNEEYLEMLKATGLDKSVFERYFVWLWNMVTFKGFGQIYNNEMKIYDTIPELYFMPLRWTLWVTVPTFFLSIIIGTSLGVLAAYKKGTAFDTIINVFTVFFIGVPSFIIASLVLGFGDIFSLPLSFIDPTTDGYGQMILSLILPITILTLSSLSLFTYNTRNEVVAVLSSQYVNIARTKGMPERKIFTKYVIKNASLPLINIIIPYYTILLAGSFVIETFFQIPGSSYIIVQALKEGEHNIIMFNALFFVAIGLVNGIIVDVLYIAMDPRIVFGKMSSFKFVDNFKSAAERKKHALALSGIAEAKNGGHNE